ncbi:hypothetical protein TRIUR3_12863 [Triticum urartu]|uniref:Uncharacterized protein n=1 Tax=Triticum urartu TaxID=4572 RepID=M7YMH3_TRIUA|nr:hypothetical protein TRIUR3_12863 [Triticum urartu]
MCGVIGLVGRVGCAQYVRDALLRSGKSDVRGTCGAPKDSRRVSPTAKEHGVCRWSCDRAWCDQRPCATSGRIRRMGHDENESSNVNLDDNERATALKTKSGAASGVQGNV